MLFRSLSEWKKINSYLLKEFYVLTPWHKEQERDSFTAYSFFDPESETGALLAFRGEDCAENTVTLSLPFANGEAYVLSDTDTGEEIKAKGSFTLSFENPREARLLWIKKNN